MNRKVVDYVVTFLLDLSKAEYVEKTKMNKDNLAMVFAPSFLRCPYEDATSIMAAAEKEKNVQTTHQSINFYCFNINSFLP